MYFYFLYVVFISTKSWGRCDKHQKRVTSRLYSSRKVAVRHLVYRITFYNNILEKHSHCLPKNSTYSTFYTAVGTKLWTARNVGNRNGWGWHELLQQTIHTVLNYLKAFARRSHRRAALFLHLPRSKIHYILRRKIHKFLYKTRRVQKLRP